jgi:hypothetical protein
VPVSWNWVFSECNAQEEVEFGAAQTAQAMPHIHRPMGNLSVFISNKASPKDGTGSSLALMTFHLEK